MNTKKCLACGVEKSLEEFYFKFYEAKNTKYYSRRCKKCDGIKNAQYAFTHRDILNKSSLKYYYKNKEDCIKKVVNKRRKQRERNPQHYMWMHIRNKCRRKNIPFNLEESDIIIPEFCPVLGIKLQMGNTESQDNSPSIDRFDSGLGYIKGNINVISKRANTLKSNGTLEEHKKLVKWMETKIEKPVDNPPDKN